MTIHTDSKKIGILLINVGTPDKADKKSVRKFLKAFLSDPRVIDLPNPLRWLLVNSCILPLRTRYSSSLYQKIWTPSGSPLLVYSQELIVKLQQEMGNGYVIAVGMRYGNPSIESALKTLKQSCNEIVVLPLFPQYSSATTQSAIEHTKTSAAKINIPSLKIKDYFYHHPSFIDAYATLINQSLPANNSEFILFSYHGLPHRQIKAVCVCENSALCSQLKAKTSCYRAQCFATSKLLAEKLNLSPSQYATAFQSRLGKLTWTAPYTNLILPELIAKGIKNIAVVCPSFVTDCLETLEEINIRAREQWNALGGTNFTCVPALNASENWVKGLAAILSESAQ